MGITPTELKLLTFIYKNRNRNRKLTRGRVSREIGHSTCLVYRMALNLEEQKMIEYDYINNRSSQLKITQIGENYLSSLLQ